jgi:hypothetical protein
MSAATEVPTKEMDSITINDKNSEIQTKNNIHVESFCVPTADSSPFGIGGDDGSSKSIVGTVTFFNKSAMVWLGWGSIEDGNGDSAQNDSRNTGTGLPVMGPMVVAMPRSKYAGIGSNDEAPCSQLVGGTNEEEMMMGWQMASRLTRKVGWPIFVSSSLDKNDAAKNRVDGIEGFGDSDNVHATAMAEKKVADIILKRKNEL